MRKGIILFLVGAIALSVAGCSGGGDAKAPVKEQAAFDDRNPADFHAPPANFRGGGGGPGAPASIGGPPPGAMKPGDTPATKKPGGN